MWPLVALAGTVCFAGVNIIDKHILDRRLPSVISLYAWIVLSHLVYVVIILAVTGLPWDAPGDKLLIAFLSGLSMGAGLAFMFFGLKLEEVSRVVAVTEVYPIYVALLAVAFLGESLNPVQWVAILLLGARRDTGFAAGWDGPDPSPLEPGVALLSGHRYWPGSGVVCCQVCIGGPFSLDGLCFSALGVAGGLRFLCPAQSLARSGFSVKKQKIFVVYDNWGRNAALRGPRIVIVGDQPGSSLVGGSITSNPASVRVHG